MELVLTCLLYPELTVKLKDDAKPFYANAPRSIPYAYKDKVQQELDSLRSQGIIEPVTHSSERCAPIVIAPKKNSDDIRLCVDFSMLNKFVKCQLYSSPIPSVNCILRQYPVSTVFFADTK